MWQLGAEARPGERRERRGLHAIGTGDIDVSLGRDVGKGDHHATAVTPTGKKAFDKRLPSTEPKLRELSAKPQAKRRSPSRRWSSDGGLTGEATTVANRLHGLLTQTSVDEAGTEAADAVPGCPDAAGAVRVSGPLRGSPALAVPRWAVLGRSGSGPWSAPHRRGPGASTTGNPTSDSNNLRSS